jgi:hypothetical protein
MSLLSASLLSRSLDAWQMVLIGLDVVEANEGRSFT